MNIKIRRFFILFSIFLVISITPAFAVKMGDVADDASKYNMESKEKKGFFAKIKFMAKGFKLIDKAKIAEKDANNNIKNSPNGDGYESMWEQNQLQQIQQKKLLDYRNSKLNNKMDTTNATNIGNKTSNNTNIINVTENNSILRSNTNVPSECKFDARYLINKLEEQNISLQMKIGSEINNNLTGNIVQIIDDRGHIRYLNVKSFNNMTVTLVTSNKNEIVMSIDLFRKSFTGIVLSDNNFENHYLLIDKINEIQKNIILQETSDAQKLRDEAKTDTIINGIVSGVGLVLFIVGIIIAVVFSRPASTKATLEMTNLGNEVSDVIGSGESSEGSFTGDAWSYSENPPAPPSGVVSPEPFPEPITSSSQVESNSENPMNNITKIPLSAGLLFLLKSKKFKEGLCIGIVGISAIISVIAGIELIINTASNTYIRLILGIVGLILILVGTVFMIYGLLCGFKSIANWITSNELLKKIKKDSNDMDEWLNKGNINNKTVTQENNTINLKTTALYNKTHGHTVT